jgi:hypothetical protein
MKRYRALERCYIGDIERVPDTPTAEFDWDFGEAGSPAHVEEIKPERPARKPERHPGA